MKENDIYKTNRSGTKDIQVQISDLYPYLTRLDYTLFL